MEVDDIVTLSFAQLANMSRKYDDDKGSYGTVDFFM